MKWHTLNTKLGSPIDSSALMPCKTSWCWRGRMAHILSIQAASTCFSSAKEGSKHCTKQLHVALVLSQLWKVACIDLSRQRRATIAASPPPPGPPPDPPRATKSVKGLWMGFAAFAFAASSCLPKGRFSGRCLGCSSSESSLA